MLLDRCIFRPTTGGTADFTVSAAVTGYMTPAQAGAVDGASYHYAAQSADLSQWEVGSGTYAASGTKLSRATVLFNSLGTNAKVNFSAVPQVMITALAEDILAVSGWVSPALNDATQAAANTAALQAALNSGTANVQFNGSGVAYISGTLVIGSNTRLVVSPSLTIRQAPTAAATNVLVNACYDRAWTTGLTLTWTSGLTMSVAWTAHGFNTTQAVWIDGTDGTTNSAYSGVFRILSITDANNFVCELRRLPDAAPSGAIQGKLADQNIIIEGGIWDFNYPNATVVADNKMAMGVIIAGVNGLTMRNMAGTQSEEYNFYLGGLATFNVSDITVFNTNKDGLKIFCPAWDGEVRNLNLTPNDDAFSLHATNDAGYTPLALSNGFGDALNIKIENVHVPNGSACGVILYVGAGYWMDQITVDGVSGRTGDTMVNIKGVTAGAAAGRFIIKNLEWFNDTGAIALAVLGAPSPNTMQVDHLVLDGLSSAKTFPASFSTYAIDVAASATVKKMVVRNLDLYDNSSITAYEVIAVQGTINSLTVEDFNFEGTGGLGDFLLNTGTINFGYFKKGRLLDNLRFVHHASAAAATYKIEDCTTSGVPQIVNVDVNAALVVYLEGNSFFNPYQFILYDGTPGASVELHSSGNKASGTVTWSAGSGALTVFGWDFPVDVTTLTRTNGSYCFNTNAGAGTLGAAGLVACQGTGAGSWHLLANPTLDY